VNDPSIERPRPALSGRELSILRLIAWGHTHKEIAEQLAISVKTVEAHKANGMRKLNLTGRAALVRYGVAGGWFSDAASRPRLAELDEPEVA
jgi:DNA-binding NarL/FixJ family response regulator